MTTAPSNHDSLPILATAVVPWTETYEFEADRFCRQVRTIAQGLTRRIYLFGTAGEGYAVTDKQFDEIAGCFWRCAREEQVQPMVGVISLSLPTIIERIARGREMGFREFQISLPAWGALNDRELATFFQETCGRFPDCRFLHYNLARTKRLLTPADYERLLAAHPNLVAVKMSTDDPAVIAGLMALRPRLQIFFTEAGYVHARKLGPCGYLISLAAVNFARAHEYVQGDDATRARLTPELRTMVATLIALAKDRFHIDGAYDKMLYRITDPDFPLRLLPPYATATVEEFARFRDSLPANWRT